MTERMKNDADTSRDEAIIDAMARHAYELWRYRFPGPVQGTSEHPRWSLTHDGVKNFWRDQAAGVLDAADLFRSATGEGD